MKFLNVMLIISLTFLSSCNTALFKRLDVNTIETPRPTYEVVQPKPVVIPEIKYYVITPENVDKVFDQMQQQGLEPVLIGTTVEGFTYIVTNNVQIQQLLQKYQKDIIEQNKYYSTPAN